MEKKPIDLGLTALDELFMTDAQRQENKLPRIRDIPLDQIDDMPNHPYKVRMDEDMDILVESVKLAGATSSGKTTLLNALLSTIPNNKRIFTIESGSRELSLVRFRTVW